MSRSDTTVPLPRSGREGDRRRSRWWGEGCGMSRRYRVVTAGMQGMTASNAAQRQPATAQRTMLTNGLDGVVRAARVEAATRSQQRTDQPLVEPDDADEHCGNALRNCVHSRVRSSLMSRSSTLPAPGRASTTHQPRAGAAARKDSRTNRLMRLRRTARAAALRLIASPRRAGGSGSGSTTIVQTAPRKRFPAESTRANSRGRRSRCARAGLDNLGCEALAALRTAAGQHAAPARRSHARAEAMGALAAKTLRLIGAFHWRIPLDRCKKARKFTGQGVFRASPPCCAATVPAIYPFLHTRSGADSRR